MNHTVTLLAAALASTTLASQALAQNPRATPVNSILPESEADILRGQTGGVDGPSGPGFDLDWYTIDGGGATYLTGGTYELGATAGQPDAGFMSGGAYELGGGFWYGVQPNSCYANCDGSTSNPVLTANDFQCFLNAYSAGASYANCDGSTVNPTLTANDFQCFLNAYSAGCT